MHQVLLISVQVRMLPLCYCMILNKSLFFSGLESPYVSTESLDCIESKVPLSSDILWVCGPEEGCRGLWPGSSDDPQVSLLSYWCWERHLHRMHFCSDLKPGPAT